jgi:hypothetical protein
MRELIVPFRFSVGEVVARLKTIATLDGITISLPGLSLKVTISDIERNVAREVLIRLADRRILNSRECCDSCIASALASLDKIRALIVDKQVQLASHTDRPLYLLLEVAAEGIRQFLTYQERLLRQARRLERGGQVDEDAQFPAVGFLYRQEYLSALESLRSHMNGTLQQIARIGGIPIPRTVDSMRYDEPWPPQLYESAG